MKTSWCILGLMAIVSGALAQVAAPAASAPAPLPEKIQIRNAAFGLLLRPRDANRADGTPLVLYPAEPWRCMTWTVRVSGDGASLKNIFTSKTFAPAEDGAVKQIPFNPDKVWKFEKLPNGQYRIADPATGKALTGRDEQTVAFDDWKDAPSQKWEILTAPEKLTM